MNVRIEVRGGGEPTPEEAAALVVAVEMLRGSQAAAAADAPSPAAGEWVLQGRMAGLHWAPLSQRWPGEAPGRSWRRVLS